MFFWEKLFSTLNLKWLIGLASSEFDYLLSRLELYKLDDHGNFHQSFKERLVFRTGRPRHFAIKK